MEDYPEVDFQPELMEEGQWCSKTQQLVDPHFKNYRIAGNIEIWRFGSKPDI